MTSILFDMQRFIRSLVALGERQLAAEKRAAALVRSVLKKQGVPFTRHHFVTQIPKMLGATLTVDGKKIPCGPASFVSGEIIGKESVVSSAMPGAWFQGHPNISVNPYCKGISRGNHYFSPALAVSHAGLRRVFGAKSVRGNVRVRKVLHQSENILVGNAKNPHTVVFAHFDSVGPGAVDNASGVAVTLDIVLRCPEFLEQHLFVFAGNEELSYDNPIYWGRGFRCLQQKLPHLFEKSKRLLVMDCVGNGTPRLITDRAVVPRAFPIHDAERLADKTVLIAADMDHLMSVYHSELDDGRGITTGDLDAARDLLVRMLSCA